MFNYIIAITIITLTLLIAISVIATSLYNGIPPMPTSPKVKTKLLRVLPPLEKGNIFEIGSGWGTLAFSLAKHFPMCSVHAYENSFFPYLFSTHCNKLKSLNNLYFHYQNFFFVSLKEADLIVCYLYPSAMKKLKKKLDNELSANCRILSHTFAIPGWKAEHIYEVNDLYHTKIYLYHFNTANPNLHLLA